MRISGKNARHITTADTNVQLVLQELAICFIYLTTAEDMAVKKL